MEIRPFRGWRYAAGDVSRLIAPPYDILSPAEKDALLAQDEHNVVAADLPVCPAKEAGPDSVYQAAADRLRQWTAAGALVRQERACLYAYEQTFQHAGKAFCRRSIIAAVKLVPFGEGIWPHEKTFPGPKADRLKLTAATGMQLSPIFGFYEDDGAAAIKLFQAAGGEPHQQGKLRQVHEKIWAVSDEKVVGEVCGLLNGRPLFIADGHHRYTTALNYRRSLGELPADHPAGFVMFVLAGMADPGLIVLPTHRVITGLDDFDLQGFVNATRRVIEYTPVKLAPADVADADAFLKPFGPHAMVFAARGDGGVLAYVARLKDASLMRRVVVKESEAWRRLDVAILHRLIIDRFMADARTERTAIEYLADGAAALEAARTGRADVVVFLQGTPLAGVKEIALSGAVMPHKSTYFYPKLATGMVLYPLS